MNEFVSENANARKNVAQMLPPKTPIPAIEIDKLLV